MATVKITELPSATSITADDLLVIVDSGNPYVTKKISWGDIDAPSGVITYGRRNNTWVDISSPANLQINRGTATEVAAYVALLGEPVYDTTSKAFHIGDGSTAGGSLIGAKSFVSGGGYTDQAIQNPIYTTTSRVTIGPQGSKWKLTGYQAYAGDPLNNSAPQIRVGTGLADAIEVLGGNYIATNTDGQIISEIIRDTGDQVTLTPDVAGAWTIQISLIVTVLETIAEEVGFYATSTEESGDLSQTWDLIIAERLV